MLQAVARGLSAGRGVQGVQVGSLLTRGLQSWATCNPSSSTPGNVLNLGVVLQQPYATETVAGN